MLRSCGVVNASMVVSNAAKQRSELRQIPTKNDIAIYGGLHLRQIPTFHTPFVAHTARAALSNTAHKTLKNNLKEL
jgi:hypothetical protein